ncbi:uncharacterized protein TRAVEDRAFT_30187 [Trametes versicolor FP-101664 SS1]|uniref:uncharacterized protein n=1 Tax=Trametes versicolor (strain FP-101664) TaxID=717944 RepID=UPI0004624944|nr:uncharacterized protein TRAVEDRAFT_30187 [Trametes versicolor FP-101664 SS1]EIW56786.1 hypothetical protein TRAVEDRAFT_30187 [Trametes versicolor FP-101664 SS1]
MHAHRVGGRVRKSTDTPRTWMDAGAHPDRRRNCQVSKSPTTAAVISAMIAAGPHPLAPALAAILCTLVSSDVISARHLRRPAVFRPAVVASCTKMMEPYRTLRVVVAGESPLPARAKMWAVHLRAQYWTRPPHTAGSRSRGSSRPCRRKATCKLGMSTLSALCTARLLKMTPVQWRTDARNAKSGMDVATADTASLGGKLDVCAKYPPPHRPRRQGKPAWTPLQDHGWPSLGAEDCETRRALGWTRAPIPTGVEPAKGLRCRRSPSATPARPGSTESSLRLHALPVHFCPPNCLNLYDALIAVFPSCVNTCAHLLRGSGERTARRVWAPIPPTCEPSKSCTVGLFGSATSLTSRMVAVRPRWPQNAPGTSKSVAHVRSEVADMVFDFA